MTPFDKDEEVDYDALGRLTNRLIEEGIGGLFVCGNTGQWWTLTQEERMRVVDKVMGAADGRTKVMVHVGSTCNRFSLQLAEHARKAGAAAISTLPPTGTSHPPEAIWGHFKAIGDSTDLPLYLYHVPQRYGELITVDRFVEAMESIPTLAGAKFSSYRIDDLMKLRLKAGRRLNILSGGSEQLLSATVCGADGGICTWYNFAPRLANKIIACVKESDIDAALAHQEILMSFITPCLSKPKVLSVLGWLIGLRGIDVGEPRRPSLPLTPEEREELWPQIEGSGILEWCI